MLVSVIITTYGASKFLSRAIRSVQNQTFKNVEIIVVDDNNQGSEERKKTERMMIPFLKDNRVKYIKHQFNQNGSAARNTGLSAAHGDFIALLDDDDIYFPNYVQKAIDLLLLNTSCYGVCFSVARLYRNIITHIQYYEKGSIVSMKDMLIGAAIGTGSNIFLRKEVLEKVGGFDTSFKRKQDLEFMLRVVKSFRILYDDSILVIKDISNVRRINYINNRDALELFNDKFSDEIFLLSEEECEQYYKKQYSFLLQIAIDSADRNYITESVQNLFRYDSSCSSSLRFFSLIKSRIASSIKYGFGNRLYSMFRYIKNLYSVRRSSDKTLHIANEELRELLKVCQSE
ncbi:glycosyltransferase [Mordavella massiliensis]|uniref:glycosyltransferase family 2 protein n=1 Tax=Mordavella massiliensis TaxID=1871024 RepID=UPI00210B9320|nr:glycosyltransferase family 2 protein [Mordavella massiliensis]